MLGKYLEITVALLAGSVVGIDLQINEESLKDAAATAAFNTMLNYTSNTTGHIPGYISEKWWEGGALFQTMIEYWYMTGDTSNNPAVSQGMYWQRGDNNYFPANYSAYLGNDDQMAWGLAAMTAAELGYPQETSMPSWLTLAEGVFQAQVRRWDSQSCGGGLHWQIFPYQVGYNIKNAISNGGLFQLSARLARYTQNHTYSDWAEKIWDWSVRVPILDTHRWTIADSIVINDQCASSSKIQWTSNYGPYLSGAAYMYNVTQGATPKWKSGLDGLLNTTLNNFFPEQYGGNIMVEIACEPRDVCDTNQEYFKGLLASDLASVTILAPYTAPQIRPKLQGSAIGAAKQCTGGADQTLCGQRWYPSPWESADLETQLSATSLFTSNLVAFADVQLATQATSSQNRSSAESQAGTTSNTMSSTSSTASTASTDRPNGAAAISRSLWVVGVLILGQLGL
ncbi:unnamed protein product [Penicillium salamii]|nr:unnamed protein product [Penicillium salamii]CAG8412485.1 unnamed protein product [Penicillium salamii]